MKADLTRNTFDPFKHFTQVLMQQGRVQLDADWNEQAAILLRRLQALAADLIGQNGGPNGSFMISPFSPPGKDFQIAPGHYYVDGILCEADATPVSLIVPQGAAPNVVQVQNWMLDGTPLDEIVYVEVFQAGTAPPYTLAQVSNPDPLKRQLTLSRLPANFTMLRRAYTYLTQPDLPAPPALVANSYLVYLDLWERHITYVEDDSIREVALGGPDTATRGKIVWQVKVLSGQEACLAASDLANQFQPGNRGWLKAQAAPSSQTSDPCITPPDSRYRGAENQLYRVEIHTGSRDAQGNSTTPTFKWSRENGSVVFPIVKLTAGTGTTTVTLENLGRDDRSGLKEGDWVETEDDDYVLQNRAENLLQVQSIDRTSMTVTLRDVSSSKVGQDSTKHPLLRRWDHAAGDPAEGGLTLGADNAALVEEDKWLELENGVQIWFQKADDTNNPNTYRTSDYWLIPARTATGNVEWPTATPTDAQGNPVKDSRGNPVIVPVALPPDGVLHHYAPLAAITVDTNGNVKGEPVDCRNPFGSLAPAAAIRATGSNTTRNSLAPPPVTPALLTDVAGLGEARASRLAQRGIDSIDKLARATPEQVAKALKGTGVSPQHAADFIEKANQLMSSEKKQ